MKIPRWLGGKDGEAEAIVAYNLGLSAKYEGRWNDSFEQISWPMSADRAMRQHFGIWASLRPLCGGGMRHELHGGSAAYHDCVRKRDEDKRYGMAAKSEMELRRFLKEWVEVEHGASVTSVTLVLSGLSQ